MLYGNHTSLSFENVKSNLLSSEKIDVGYRSEPKGEALVVRGSGIINPTFIVVIVGKILIIFLSATK
jgi:hypothetical protein